MEHDKKPLSVAHERRVVGYLRPGLQAKFDNYVQSKAMTNSEAINEAVRLLVVPGDKRHY
jgi:hypothetical protein